MDEIFTQGSALYRFIATLVLSRHRDGVALFYQDSPILSVEVIRQFGVNVIACQMRTGERR